MAELDGSPPSDNPLVPLVLGVDLDGVCADYTTAFRAIAALELGVDQSALPLERSWDFSEWGLSVDQFQELHHLAVSKHRMLRDMPVMDEAAESLWRLSDSGVWIRIITHRLYVNWGHQRAIADTVDWLDRNRIPYRDICFLGDKPQVGAHLYIEDAPHNVLALQNTGNRVIICDAPYNQHLKGLRAADWGACEHLILQQAAELGFRLQTQLPGFEAGTNRLEPGSAE